MSTPRWDDHLRPIEGESNEAYWLRQKLWTEQEAIRIGGWCEGARAMLDATDPPRKPNFFERFFG